MNPPIILILTGCLLATRSSAGQFQNLQDGRDLEYLERVSIESSASSVERKVGFVEVLTPNCPKCSETSACCSPSSKYIYGAQYRCCKRPKTKSDTTDYVFVYKSIYYTMKADVKTNTMTILLFDLSTIVIDFKKNVAGWSIPLRKESCYLIEDVTTASDVQTFIQELSTAMRQNKKLNVEEITYKEEYEPLEDTSSFPNALEQECRNKDIYRLKTISKTKSKQKFSRRDEDESVDDSEFFENVESVEENESVEEVDEGGKIEETDKECVLRCANFSTMFWKYKACVMWICS